MKRVVAAVGLLLIGALIGLTGCGNEAHVTVPNVVGVQLDKAHQALAKASLKKHKDKDYFGSRFVFRDANWVVLDQDPASGTVVGANAAIILRVGKISEAKTVQLLQEGSPVLAKIRAQDAAKAAKDAAAEASRAKAALAYVNAIDPTLLLARGDLPQIKSIGADIRSGKVGGNGLVLAVADADTAISNYKDRLESLKPDSDTGLKQAYTDLQAALSTFGQAEQTLLGAVAPNTVSTLQRFDSVYASAVTAWNAVLTKIYQGTNVPRPLIK